MRKEDRIRQQGQNEPDKKPEKTPSRPAEQMKGQAQSEQTPRKPGALPIPD
jgi:hypothetical protein